MLTGSAVLMPLNGHFWTHNLLFHQILLSSNFPTVSSLGSLQRTLL